MKRAAILLSLLSLLAACRTDRSDPEDLRGVFDHPGARSATASVRASQSGAPAAAAASAASAASAAPAIASGAPLVGLESGLAVNRRKPLPGPCIQVTGEAARANERSARRPACRRAEILERRGPDGAPQYACVFTPGGVEKRAPLPLIVFFHGQDESPAKVSKETALSALGDALDLSGDPQHLGYLVLAPQARRLQLHVAFDIGFVSPENEDVRTTEYFIEELAKRGWIDRRRVYAVGAGKGGDMAALWTMLRPDHVAAFATFGSDASAFTWTCPVEPPPAAVLYRACDTVTRCLDVEQWLSDRESAHATTLAFRLNAANQLAPSCELNASRCGKQTGEANHYRWPKGKDRALVEFLGRFSLDLR